MQKNRVLLVAVLASASICAQVPAQASIRAVAHCGDVLVRDAVLDQDLRCAGSGLTIVGGVTLDLRGHSLVGDGTGTAVEVDAYANSLPAVRVKRGTISGWDQGVHLNAGGTDTSNLFLDRLTISSVSRAAVTVDLGRVSMDHTTLRDSGTGVAAFLTGVDMNHSVLRGNGIAVEVLSGGWAHATRSRFLHNQQVFSLSEVGATLDDVDIEDNGLVLSGYQSAVSISDSDVKLNQVGFRTSGFDHVTNNSFVGNGLALDLGSSLPGSAPTVRGNVFKDNTLAYRALSGPADFGLPVLLEANEFRGNVDAVVTDASSRLRGNRAVKNTGLGIYAPGAADLGGNVAAKNGIEPQCVGVVCTG